MARRDRFPRARSFWWIFAPIYSYAVIFRVCEELEQRLRPQLRGRFSARTAIAMVIAGNIWAAFSIALPEPARIGFLIIGFAFQAAATYIVQCAANGYLSLAYPNRVPRSMSLGEVVAVVLGVTLLGLDVLGATRVLAAQGRIVAITTSATPTPTFIVTPTPMPTPSPTAFPPSKSTFVMSSDPGDFIGQGASKSFDQSTAAFRDISKGMLYPSLAIHIETIPVAYQATDWFFVLAPAAGQSLGVGTYVNGKLAGFNGQAPGIDIHGEGRDCADVTGTFTISRLVIDSKGQLDVLDATFTEHCNNPNGPAFRGALHFERS
ncbi:MAG: hypothetical protein E6J51_12380 [Chloroflexi bacterium]|nr:MAG: hypothetical protein E6J51_12380 [Chloroflexota bacterium]